ncbi:hypothetical protein KC351_g7727 [Hortaea werneckii]|nr:hypothetical protein KC351_g7727 [Hortaea werneckii]
MTVESAGGVTASAPNIRPDGRVDEDDDAAWEVDGDIGAHPKKKRKVMKDGDKKYHCPHEDCGKAYSRAEHLYRHQLNHTPKTIYRCDFPGCVRHFVRADLCARHRERHTAKGSHLQRKDAFQNSQRVSTNANGSGSPPMAAKLPASPEQTIHPLASSFADTAQCDTGHGNSYTTAAHPYGTAMPELPPLQMPVGPQVEVNAAFSNPTGNTTNGSSPPPPAFSLASPSDSRQYYYNGAFARPPAQPHGFVPQAHVTLNSMQPPPLSSPPAMGPTYSQHTFPSPSMSSQHFRSPSTTSALPSLPPFGFPGGYGTTNGPKSGSMISQRGLSVSSVDQQPMPNSRANSVTDFNVLDQMQTGYAMPVFGHENFNRSPPMPFDDNLLSSLFDNNNLEAIPPSPPTLDTTSNSQMWNMSLPRLDTDGTPNEAKPQPGPWNDTSGDHMLDINTRESSVSEMKKNRLASLVKRWNGIEHNNGRRDKSEILRGDWDKPYHVMSLHMLKTYLSSYWAHLHHQMPILHRPTFNSETCPDLLLLAMMCLGATCLERTHSLDLTLRSAELAFFIAYHIRWEVFKDAEFRPTAKLWTFQTMLLLELFEKLFSTRNLHERAHIHHATTLTVMRRGSSLIGRNATDLSQNGDDPTRTPPGPDGSINTSGQNTPDASWNKWITAEATRRAAFTAFIIDSTHATLFGHTAVMSPHDLRLPLPCDEALWSATSSAEVQRIESSLAANGFKPTSFLDGLKRTLNGQKVRTNTFGRVILMAGLLNVSWHMNQRDLQVSSLGATSMLGNQIKWRSPLTRAFDFWRRDFDESLSKNELWLQVCNPKNVDRMSTDHRDNVFESRTCLHSLAHMAMHVDIIDCQVFAGSDRVLGLVVLETDCTVVQRRMREQWAPSARARDATFYALKFLREVLIPEDLLATQRAHPHQPLTFTYSARDDYLLNRPWVLFFALLIVWSYGYALDGPLRPSNYTLTTRELQIRDMQRYLVRVGGVTTPDELESIKDRNSCLGLLLLLQETFKQPRWELLHDANEVLGSCIDLLLPGHHEVDRRHSQGV